jgi:hypothetical protein
VGVAGADRGAGVSAGARPVLSVPRPTVAP